MLCILIEQFKELWHIRIAKIDNYNYWGKTHKPLVYKWLFCNHGQAQSKRCRYTGHNKILKYFSSLLFVKASNIFSLLYSNGFVRVSNRPLPFIHFHYHFTTLYDTWTIIHGFRILTISIDRNSIVL